MPTVDQEQACDDGARPGHEGEQAAGHIHSQQDQASQDQKHGEQHPLELFGAHASRSFRWSSRWACSGLSGPNGRGSLGPVRLAVASDNLLRQLLQGLGLSGVDVFRQPVLVEQVQR